MFVTGGLNERNNATKTFAEFDLETNSLTTTDLPQLNEARASHSSQVLGRRKLYVFCGFTFGSGASNSIEILNIRQLKDRDRLQVDAPVWNKFVNR